MKFFRQIVFAAALGVIIGGPLWMLINIWLGLGLGVTIFTLLALRSLMNAEWAKTGSTEGYDDGSLLDDNGPEIKRVNARTGYPELGSGVDIGGHSF